MGKKSRKAAGAATGALSGAATGAGIGALGGPIGVGAGAAIGGVVGGISGLFGGGGDDGPSDEQLEAQRQAEIAQAKLGVEKSEDTRLAHAGLAGGVDFDAIGVQGIDPNLASNLGVRRNYDELIEAGAVDPTAGSGQEFIAGLGDDVFNAGTDYAKLKAIQAADGVGTGQDEALQGGGDEVATPDFDTGEPINTVLDNPLAAPPTDRRFF